MTFFPNSTSFHISSGSTQTPSHSFNATGKNFSSWEKNVRQKCQKTFSVPILCIQFASFSSTIFFFLPSLWWGANFQYFSAAAADGPICLSIFPSPRFICLLSLCFFAELFLCWPVRTTFLFLKLLPQFPVRCTLFFAHFSFISTANIRRMRANNWTKKV